MRPETESALVDALGGFDRIVEVGIGDRHAVAATLASQGTDVLATDIQPRDPPSGVRFMVDDITEPTMDLYEDRELVYALNCPPELHASVQSVARRVGAAAMFTTLGTDPPAVDADPTQLPGDTVFRVRTGRD